MQNKLVFLLMITVMGYTIPTLAQEAVELETVDGIGFPIIKDAKMFR